uniref:Uncharacterized protein n=1 Tax=uncultured marine virus TaxID=186617 RepID=A0A0F7L4Z6_9VIRU|nr:hypothetical protein [uncultured marine virus]
MTAWKRATPGTSTAGSSPARVRSSQNHDCLSHLLYRSERTAPRRRPSTLWAMNFWRR